MFSYEQLMKETALGILQGRHIGLTPTIVRDKIEEDFSEIRAKARTLPCTLPKPGSMKLLGSSTKTELGQEHGVLTSVVYMSPADEAFAQGDKRTLCPFATKDCKATCLGNKAGRMIQSPQKNARIWKSTLFLGQREMFAELLIGESIALCKKAKRLGLTPAIRIDGSTDTGFGVSLAAALHDIGSDAKVYDYTKSFLRAKKFARGEYSENYDLTFSRSGENDAECREVLRLGGKVAVVFDTKPGRKGRKAEALPEEFMGVPVIDGDYMHGDARFLDPRSSNGTVVGLRFKQAADRDGALKRAGRFVVATK